MQAVAASKVCEEFCTWRAGRAKAPGSNADASGGKGGSANEKAPGSNDKGFGTIVFSTGGDA